MVIDADRHEQKREHTYGATLHLLCALQQVKDAHVEGSRAVSAVCHSLRMCDCHQPIASPSPKAGSCRKKDTTIINN